MSDPYRNINRAAAMTLAVTLALGAVAIVAATEHAKGLATGSLLAMVFCVLAFAVYGFSEAEK